MWGPFMMIAPVFTENDQRKIYFPHLNEGRWIDFYTGKAIDSEWDS